MKCQHEYGSEISNISTTGLIYVCKKCGLVKPFKYQENYFTELIKKCGDDCDGK